MKTLEQYINESLLCEGAGTLSKMTFPKFERTVMNQPITIAGKKGVITYAEKDGRKYTVAVKLDDGETITDTRDGKPQDTIYSITVDDLERGQIEGHYFLPNGTPLEFNIDTNRDIRGKYGKMPLQKLENELVGGFLKGKDNGKEYPIIAVSKGGSNYNFVYIQDGDELTADNVHPISTSKLDSGDEYEVVPGKGASELTKDELMSYIHWFDDNMSKKNSKEFINKEFELWYRIPVKYRINNSQAIGNRLSASIYKMFPQLRLPRL